MHTFGHIRVAHIHSGQIGRGCWASQLAIKVTKTKNLTKIKLYDWVSARSRSLCAKMEKRVHFQSTWNHCFPFTLALDNKIYTGQCCQFLTLPLHLFFICFAILVPLIVKPREKIRNREKIFHIIIVLMCDREAQIAIHDSHVFKYYRSTYESTPSNNKP